MEEFDKKLADLKTALEESNKKEAQGLIDAFKAEFKDELENSAKSIKEEMQSKLDGLDELQSKINAVQEHADKLDIKLQSKGAGNEPKENFLVKAVKDNFEKIKNVRKGQNFSVELDVEAKAVANMTLSAHLTGDQPRDYNFNVVTIPGQLLNVSDLVGVVNIGGGTYTFPRETGSEGSISAQTEGSDKSQIDYDLAMIDVNTDFIAGFAVYSKKMANNLPFLESWLPTALRRDYAIAENSSFNTTLAAAATASAVTSGNKIERLISEISTLEGSNYATNGIVVRPADYWDILVTEKSTGAGYGLPGVVSLDGGQLRINGIPIYRANWLAANKYYVGDWSRINKVVTEGLSLDFSEHDEDNFRKNNITARIEAQVALAVEQPAAIIYGDFTATS